MEALSHCLTTCTYSRKSANHIKRTIANRGAGSVHCGVRSDPIPDPKAQPPPSRPIPVSSCARSRGAAAGRRNLSNLAGHATVLLLVPRYRAVRWRPAAAPGNRNPRYHATPGPEICMRIILGLYRTVRHTAAVRARATLRILHSGVPSTTMQDSAVEVGSIGIAGGLNAGVVGTDAAQLAPELDELLCDLWRLGRPCLL